MNTVDFYKKIKVLDCYDVVVVGGGVAGVCSAITASRKGLKVLLVEASPSLGGMATIGGVGPFMTNYDGDGEEKTVAGLFLEIVNELKKYSAVISSENVDTATEYTSFIKRYHKHVTPFSSQHLEIVLGDMARSSGVEVLCYTKFIDCVMDGKNITHAILSTISDVVAVKAKIFVDATGIALVAKKAGAPTYIGDEENNIPQPATLMFEVDGACDNEYKKLGCRPPKPVKAYRTPFDGKYKVNHFHVYNVDATSSKEMTNAHMVARKQVLLAHKELLKTQGFENCRISSVAQVLGVRESSHVIGEYQITVNDVKDGVKFDDRIAVYGFGMDVHNRTENESGNFKIETAKRYYIPYRSLLPKNTKNLFVVGKTISATSQAMGGIRCMPCCMAIGQAVGIASSIAVSNSVNIRDIDIRLLQEKLVTDGAIID